MSSNSIFNENESKRASYYDGLYDCPICLEIYKNSILQAPCGHRFCKDCFDDVVRKRRSLNSTKCPVDGSVIDISKIFTDRAFEKQLASVNIICCFSCNGCDWSGNIQSLKMGYKENMGHNEQTWEHGETALDKLLIRGGNMAVLKRLKEHRDCCEYIDIVCSKGCGLKLPQKDIEEHLISCDGQRKQNKKDMGSEDEFSEEELQLPQSRPGPEGESSKVVKADRKDSSASGSISNSINDSLKLCKFNKLGCAFKGNRFELDLHMDIASEKHLDILCKSIQDIKSDYIKKENKIIAKHDKQIKTLQEYITKQNIIIKDLHETNKLLESTTNSNRKFVKELTQQCDVFNQEVARLKVQLNTFQEENIDSVRTNYTGSMIWKINNVAEHIKSAIEKSEFSIFSPIFYTSKSGYKLRAQIFLNGVGKYFGEYVSIFLHVLPSEYDPILKWPFLHKVTFTLFQQKDNMDTASHVTFTLAPNEKEESFQKPKECQMNDGKGSSQFVSLEKLHKDMFIKNNAMFIKIKVHCKSPTCRKDSHM